MPLKLYACVRGTCPTVYFKTEDQRCPSCDSLGVLVVWRLKPARPPDERN